MSENLTTAEMEAVLPDIRKALADPKPAATPLHKHEAFDKLRAHLNFIQLGADALRGLGAMFLPDGGSHQMNQAFSLDASAVFSFFGEAMRRPAIEAYDAMERLESAAEMEVS